MATILKRRNLLKIIEEALKNEERGCHHVEVAKHIWKNHRADLEASGNFFYTWQYDLRWAALMLRKQGRLRPADSKLLGVWVLA